MRKITIIMISMLFLMMFPIHSSAYEGYPYINTVQNVAADEYVRRNAIGIIKSSDKNIDERNVEIGKGIYVFGSENYSFYVYPIWKNDAIISELQVYIDEYGEVSITYSSSISLYINALYRYSTPTYPLTIFYLEGKLFVSAGRKTIDVREGVISYSSRIAVPQISQLQSGALENVDMSYTIASMRSASWSTYAYYANGVTNCIPYCLYNIFKNYGIFNYSSVEQVRTSMVSANPNYSSGYGMFSYSETVNYFTANSIVYTPTSTTGKKTFATCQSTTNAGYYILALCNHTQSWASGSHAVVVYGTEVVNGIQRLKAFDPHASNYGLITLTYSNPTFTSSGTEYSWNMGYFTYVHTQE